MNEKIINLVIKVFDYYKQAINNNDIFDPVNDNDIINKLALSQTADELEMDKSIISDLLQI